MYTFQRHCFFPLLRFISCLRLIILSNNLCRLIVVVVGAGKAVAVFLCFLLEITISGATFFFAIFKGFVIEDGLGGDGGGGGASTFDFNLLCFHFLIVSESDELEDKNRLKTRFLLIPLPIWQPESLS